MTITKPKLLLIIGIAIAGVSLGLGAWAATITTPTSIKIIQCMGERERPKSNIYRTRCRKPF
jgi:heterodisulfide reductase subunit A-like polyferredoxin